MFSVSFLWLVLTITIFFSASLSNKVFAQQESLAYQPNPPPPNSNNPIMRAWQCHGRSQRDLVDRLRQAQIVQTATVQSILERVDRQNYVPQNPYQDAPQGIGKAQTISAPHMHAHVLEEIIPPLEERWSKGQRAQSSTTADAKRMPVTPPEQVRVLDVGCGSGYLTACFGRWVQSMGLKEPNGQQLPGRVYGMDIHPELVQLSRENLKRSDGDLLESGIVQLKYGNGWEGWPEAAPFDAIHVGAAASSFPTALAMQLKIHGILIVPVGPNGGVQTLVKVERVSDTENKNVFDWHDFKITELLGVRYVPLVRGPE